MADYSYQDLMKMQNDAIRRAEEMQRRARQSVGIERKQGAVKEEFSEKSRENTEETRHSSEHKNGTKLCDDKMKSVFGDLNIDSDKALLLSLILLLSEEKADELLIMALIYMIM